MSKIYTRQGDHGATQLLAHERVSKTDGRIEANGEIDELVAVLGMARAQMVEGDAHRAQLAHIQHQLMAVMGHVASSGATAVSGLTDEVAQMETQIDSLSADAPFRFVVPGTTLVEATLHLARTKARTAERRLWGLKGQYAIGDDVLMYLNRLSDYLFALATHYAG